MRSHLSVTDLAALAARGGRPAGPPPLPPANEGAAVEVDRTVNPCGLVSLGSRQVLAAEILAGRRVGIRLDGSTLLFFDPDSRTLLRARPNPLTGEQARRLRGARPAGPPPIPAATPVRVQRRVTDTGVITVCRQTIALGRDHAGATVTVPVAEDTLTIEVGDQTRVVRRTTSKPVVQVKANRPRKVVSVV